MPVIAAPMLRRSLVFLLSCVIALLPALLPGRAMAQEAGATVYAGTPGTTVATCTLRNGCGVPIGTTDGQGNPAHTFRGAGPPVGCARRTKDSAARRCCAPSPQRQAGV
jgi:hypothetical protein